MKVPAPSPKVRFSSAASAQASAAAGTFFEEPSPILIRDVAEEKGDQQVIAIQNSNLESGHAILSFRPLSEKDATAQLQVEAEKLEAALKNYNQ